MRTRLADPSDSEGDSEHDEPEPFEDEEEPAACQSIPDAPKYTEEDHLLLEFMQDAVSQGTLTEGLLLRFLHNLRAPERCHCAAFRAGRESAPLQTAYEDGYDSGYEEGVRDGEERAKKREYSKAYRAGYRHGKRKREEEDTAAQPPASTTVSQ